jgi:PAS domain S-box-containing protein
MPPLSEKSILQALEATTLVGLAAVDGEGRQTYVSAGFCAMVGYDARELIGVKAPFAYWPPEEMDAIRAAMGHTLHGDAPRDGFHLRFARKDATRIDVRLIISALDGDGWLALVLDVTRSAAMEEKLRRSERLLAEAQRIAHVGSWEWDVASDRIWWSDEMYRVYGLEPGSTGVDYQAYLSRLPPEDRVSMQRIVARAAETGEPFETEHRAVLPDGSVRTVLARGAVEQDAAGRVVRMAGTGQDITEIKRLEVERARLQRAHDERLRLHAILEQLPAGVMIADAAGRLTYSNRAAESIFGGSIPSPDQARAYAEAFTAWRPDGTRLPSEEFPLVRALSGRSVSGEEVDFQRPDGLRATIRANASPLRDEAGNVAGAVTAYYDVTELKRAQEDRERDRQRLHLTFLQAPVALAIFRGPEHRFELANPRYEEMVGRTGLSGRTVREAFPELPHDHVVFAALDRAFGTGERVSIQEMDVPLRRFGRDEPRDAWFNFVLEPLRDADGTVSGSMVVAAEVTEQVEARRNVEALRTQAEAANRTKDEFLAILGHELRNPLAPIVTALQLLRARDVPDIERERALIERQVRHLLRLVDDLLDVARVARGGVDLRKRGVEIQEVVSAAVELASPLLEEKGHRLEVDLEPGLAVFGDPARLTQVVANLLTNAAKYTNPRGRISVRAAREAGEAVIEVSDEGIGIAPDLLPRIFELFVQGGRGLDRRQGGLGLGLPIVKSLTALHGGRVEARSAGLGKGSSFIVGLPAMAGEVRGTVEAPPPVRPAAGPRHRVLIVDDNADAAMMLGEAVSSFGHDVRTTLDGPSALDVAPSFAPDVALLDLGLPVMDGFELARRLRAVPGLSDLRLVAVTGYGQRVDRDRSREAGFDVHLVKPVDLDEIASLLHELPLARDLR